VTVKGKIRFKVIEPGVVLLTEDPEGKDHSGDMFDSDVWERLYIPITENSDDLFQPEAK
jgi:hypothetical protein